MTYSDRLNLSDDRQCYVWYRPNRHISDFITFDMSDLLSSTGKKITKKSHTFVNVGSGFDCETSKISTDSNISVVYIWQFSIGKVTFLCRDINEITRFIKELSKMVYDLSDKATLLIGDANINYEFSYFKPLFYNNITQAFLKDTTHVCTFTLFNNLKFIEILGVFGRNLATIAKNYTRTQKRKGDLNYDKIRNSSTYMSRREILYSVNDVAIIAELLPIAHQLYTVKGDKIPMTQTGIVRQEIMKNYAPTKQAKNKIQDEMIKLIGTESEYKYFRRYGYSGGLTHSNFKYVGKKLNNIVCYDLTSAYPWALNAKNYPAGELIKCTCKSEYKTALSHKHWYMDITLANLKSKSTHSTLSLHKCINISGEITDNGRIYSADYVRVLINEIDYSNICAIYDFDKSKSQVNDIWYFTKSCKAPQKMLDVMNDWYIKKTVLKPLTKDKHANDPDYSNNCKEYMRLKNLINSVYGMCVTQLYDKEIQIGDIDFEQIQCDWDSYNKTVFNPYIGYWCTAYVRQRLIQCISKFPDSIYQYDTDSIYCDATNTDLLDYVKEINNNVLTELFPRVKDKNLLDLGQWDCDGEYKHFLCLGSKRYIGEHDDGTYKITFAGAVDRDIKRISKRDNIDIFEYIKAFTIMADDSTKTGAFHSTDTDMYTVTDYKGNSINMNGYGCTTVINVPFTAVLSTHFSELRQTYLKAYE